MQKSLWAYWHDGEAGAPYLVRQCLDSWRRLNPEWTLRLLDRETAEEWADVAEYRARDDIGLQAFTDILRLALLARHGGAWVDATLYCARPLDRWLAARTRDHFFGFASQRPDRLITTWFLYGDGESRLLNAWHDEVRRYWRAHRFSPVGYGRKQILRKLTSLRKRHLLPNDIWFSGLVTRIVGAYPYPVNMYLFERALSRRPELRPLWHERDHLYDEPAERLQNRFGMNAPRTSASVAFLEGESTPVHKLNWRQDLGEAKSGSNLELLLERNAQRTDT